MKVIYSFKKLKTEHYKPLNTNFFKLAKLSVELAKKYYKVEFYGDSDSFKLFDERGIEFDKVILLDSILEYDGDITSMSKLLAMVEQSEPYMCLDFDTLLLQKIPETHSITYGYPEITKIHLHNILTEESQDDYLKYIDKYYKNSLEKYKNKLPNFVNPSCSEIPNYSLFMVNHPTLIKEILNDIFTRFTKDELEEMGAMFIEQLLIYLYLLELDIDINFLYKNNLMVDADLINTIKYKFIHYIRYHEDNKFEEKINMISKSYNISLKLNEKLF